MEEGFLSIVRVGHCNHRVRCALRRELSDFLRKEQGKKLAVEREFGFPEGQEWETDRE